MALVEQNLGGDVLRCAANRVSALSDHLGEAIIDQLEIAIIANHDVFGLEVTVHNVFTVQVGKHAADLSAIETIVKKLDFD